MTSNRQLLYKLEQWMLNRIPPKYKVAWSDINVSSLPGLECKFFDAYQSTQSDILKEICKKNHIPFVIYDMNSFNSDQGRLKEYSNFINWKSENYDTILFSKLLKEQIYFGEFKKYSCDNLDFFPFADLTKSQVDSLLVYLQTGEDVISPSVNSLLEWLYHQDIQFKIISSNTDPTKNVRWATYSLEQKSIIAKYYSLIKLRDHKISKDNIFKYEQ